MVAKHTETFNITPMLRLLIEWQFIN